MAVPEVNYSVKELLAKIEGKLDGVIITIGQKADKHDVDSLSDRVKAIEDQHRVADQVAATSKTFWERWRLKFAWGGGLLVAAAQFHTAFPHLFH